MKNKINYKRILLILSILLPIQTVMIFSVFHQQWDNENNQIRNSSIHFKDNIYFKDADSMKSWTPDKIEDFENGIALVDDNVKDLFKAQGGIIILTNNIEDDEDTKKNGKITVGRYSFRPNYIQINSFNIKGEIHKTVVHEFGHYVDKGTNYKRLIDKQFKNTYKKALTENRGEYTEYSLQSESEFFAETYAVIKITDSNSQLVNESSEAFNNIMKSFKSQNRYINTAAMLVKDSI